MSRQPEKFSISFSVVYNQFQLKCDDSYAIS